MARLAAIYLTFALVCCTLLTSAQQSPDPPLLHSESSRLWSPGFKGDAQWRLYIWWGIFDGLLIWLWICVPNREYGSLLGAVPLYWWCRRRRASRGIDPGFGGKFVRYSAPRRNRLQHTQRLRRGLQDHALKRKVLRETNSFACGCADRYVSIMRPTETRV